MTNSCLEELDAILAMLRREAMNAARRNKPTMWAYYERMRERLTNWFCESADAARGAPLGERRRCADGGVAGAALALVQRADTECHRLPRDEAADLWAMSVYGNRILRRWVDMGHQRPKRSLRWLRQRALGGVA